MTGLVSAIVEYKELVIVFISLIVLLLTIGRKRAIQLVFSHLENAREDIIRNIGERAHVYANYIYIRLPKGAKAFVTIRGIEKIIKKFTNDKTPLDK